MNNNANAGTEGSATESALRPIWVFNLLLVVVLIGIGMFLAKGETVERHYADAAKARQDNAEWLPPSLPKEARRIRLKYNLDSNHRISRFHNAGGLDYELVTKCRKISVDAVRWPRLTAPWWPAPFRDAPDQEAPRHTFFDCPDDKGTYAYDPYNKEAFYWSYAQ